MREYGRLRFVFRHLPLTDVHPNAALAAEASEAANAQGKFWEMHDMLFANQDALLFADLARYATELGLDVARFERDLREGRYGARVAQDVESADSSGVVGTPTLFINDVIYRGPRDVESLEAAVARASTMVDARAELRQEQAE